MDNDYLSYQFDQLNRQAEITEAINAYKQELIDFLDNEIDSKEHFLTTGLGDNWDTGMINAFQLTKEFIQQS